MESIGLFYTNIRTWDNRRLVIPNKLLSDQTIRNYTLVDPRMPALVAAAARLRGRRRGGRRLLLQEARAHPLFLAEPEPSVQVIEADNLGVTVRLMAWAASQADAWTLAVDVREACCQAAKRRARPGSLGRRSGFEPAS